MGDEIYKQFQSFLLFSSFMNDVYRADSCTTVLSETMFAIGQILFERFRKYKVQSQYSVVFHILKVLQPALHLVRTSAMDNLKRRRGRPLEHVQ